MKIALYQTHIIWEDKKTNYLHLEETLQKMRNKKIDIFLLPEMSFTGFSMNIDVTKERHMETVSKMTEYAKQYQTAIGFGWVKDCGKKAENHYTVVNKSGEIISDYTKIHPFSFSGEDKKFQGGETITNFILEGIPFSSFICYDLRFPEVFQIASKEAHVVIVPANWPQKREKHWRCLLRARAIENQVYILAVNCVGQIGGLDYTGSSCVIDPNGEMLLELSGQEGVLEYELTDDVELFRSAFPVKQDRKEGMYCNLKKDFRLVEN